MESSLLTVKRETCKPYVVHTYSISWNFGPAYLAFQHNEPTFDYNVSDPGSPYYTGIMYREKIYLMMNDRFLNSLFTVYRLR